MPYTTDESEEEETRETSSPVCHKHIHHPAAGDDGAVRTRGVWMVRPLWSQHGGSSKKRSRTTVQSSDPTPGYLCKGNKLWVLRALRPKSLTIHSSQATDTITASADGWRADDNREHPRGGILFGLFLMAEKQQYCRWLASQLLDPEAIRFCCLFAALMCGLKSELALTHEPEGRAHRDGVSFEKVVLVRIRK